MSLILTKNALKRLKNIHRLSRRYNGPSKNKHLRKLLALSQKHIDEILILSQKRDPHYIVETGDLLILCLEILIENKRDVHVVIGQCFSRYENKLKQLINEGK